MKSMMSLAPGGPETLRLVEAETPMPGAGEVRIQVRAAGVNFPDTLIIRDLYQFKPARPFAPGGEVAGVIDAVGPGVEGLKVGARVLAGGVFGGFSTHFLCPAARVFQIPDAMAFEHAAAFMLTYATAHYALKDRAALRAGERVFILGAAGGVGAAAIEIGKAMGARVVAGVSTPEKAAFCAELGADETIVYPAGALDREAQKAFADAVKRACGGDGADVVVDPVGGDYAEPSVRALAWDGRFLVIGFPAGIPKLPLNLTLLKSCQIVGVFWGAFIMRNPARHAEHVAELFHWYKEGKIRPRITARFPLENAADALRLIEGRKALGKVVLIPAGLS